MSKQDKSLGLNASFWNKADSHAQQLTSNLKATIRIEPEAVPRKIRIVSAAMALAPEKAARLGELLRQWTDADRCVVCEADGDVLVVPGDRSYRLISRLPALIPLQEGFIACEDTHENRMALLATPDLLSYDGLRKAIKVLPAGIHERLLHRRSLSPPFSNLPVRVVCPDTLIWRTIQERKIEYLLWQLARTDQLKQEGKDQPVNARNGLQLQFEAAYAQLADAVNDSLDRSSSRDFLEDLLRSFSALSREWNSHAAWHTLWRGMMHLRPRVRLRMQPDNGTTEYPAIYPLPCLWLVLTKLYRVARTQGPRAWVAEECDDALADWRREDEKSAMVVAKRMAGKRVATTGNSRILGQAKEIADGGAPLLSLGMIQMEGDPIELPPGIEDLGSYREFIEKLTAKPEGKPDLVYSGCLARCPTRGFFCRGGAWELATTCREAGIDVRVAATRDKLCEPGPGTKPLCKKCEDEWTSRFSPLPQTKWDYNPPVVVD